MITPIIPWHEYFTSVADVWVLWAAGLVALVCLVRRAYRGRKWSSLAKFAADERGASYALSYVLTFPFYLLLMCLIIQATLVLMVKMGTVYAAYAAARTAIVWRPSLPERATGESDSDRYQYTQDKAQRAAAIAMTPFASGKKEHRNGMLLLGLFPKIDSVLDAPAYWAMYQLLGSHNAGKSNSSQYLLQKYHTPALGEFSAASLAKNEYLLNKFFFASAATSVEFEQQQKLVPWNEDFQVTVTYRMPMHVPVVGRVFGNRFAPFYARDIETTATLPSEAPETDSGRLNIPYDPRKLVIR